MFAGHKHTLEMSLSITEKLVLAILLLLMIAFRSYAGQATLAWDGSNDPKVTGYKLYYGTASRSYSATPINVGKVTSHTATNLAEGSRYYYAVTAYDATGAESAFSNEVSGTIPYAAPVANFNANVLSSLTPLNLSFQSTSAGNVNSYAWNFGDGTSSTLQSPSHSYAAAGTYSVSLTVTGRGGANTVSKSVFVSVPLPPPAARNYSPDPDLDGDGKTDIVWRNRANGANGSLLLNVGTDTSVNPVTSSARLASVDANWSIVATGDFNADGKSDILWRNATTGDNAIWLMNGSSLVAGTAIWPVADVNWEVVGAGDFNGDGRSDILWRHKVNGGNAVWLMKSASMVGAGPLPDVVDANWKIVGIGDFNGDGKSDVLWRHATAGDNAIWFMDGTKLAAGSAAIAARPDPNWQVVGVGDFNGDGKSDIVWRHSDGRNTIWLMDGINKSGAAKIPTETDTDWRIVAVGDYNGDGRSDLLRRHAVTGELQVWLMNGTTILGDRSLGLAFGPNKQIAR